MNALADLVDYRVGITGILADRHDERARADDGRTADDPVECRIVRASRHAAPRVRAEGGQRMFERYLTSST